MSTISIPHITTRARSSKPIGVHTSRTQERFGSADSTMPHRRCGSQEKLAKLFPYRVNDKQKDRR